MFCLLTSFSTDSYPLSYPFHIRSPALIFYLNSLLFNSQIWKLLSFIDFDTNESLHPYLSSPCLTLISAKWFKPYLHPTLGQTFKLQYKAVWVRPPVGPPTCGYAHLSCEEQYNWVEEGKGLLRLYAAVKFGRVVFAVYHQY